MSTEEIFAVDNRLVAAWQRTLPTTLDEGDKAEVMADESDMTAIRITINVAGRTGYSFDFKCRYVDSREVRVELLDVDQDGQSIDERTDVIQTLAADLVRHIHECAQVLHQITNR